jgi:hypothetical protein
MDALPDRSPDRVAAVNSALTALLQFWATEVARRWGIRESPRAPGPAPGSDPLTPNCPSGPQD